MEEKKSWNKGQEGVEKSNGSDRRRDSSPHGNKSDPPTSGKKLYVGNLSDQTGKEEIEKAFSKFGPIKDVKIISEVHNGRSRKYAFVTMENATDGIAATREAHNNMELDGKLVVVEIARGISRSRDSAPPKQHESHYSDRITDKRRTPPRSDNRDRGGRDSPPRDFYRRHGDPRDYRPRERFPPPPARFEPYPPYPPFPYPYPYPPDMHHMYQTFLIDVHIFRDRYGAMRRDFDYRGPPMRREEYSRPHYPPPFPEDFPPVGRFGGPPPMDWRFPYPERDRDRDRERERHRDRQRDHPYSRGREMEHRDRNLRDYKERNIGDRDRESRGSKQVDQRDKEDARRPHSSRDKRDERTDHRTK